VEFAYRGIYRDVTEPVTCAGRYRAKIKAKIAQGLLITAI
jgi:hypothetical protein